ncbi:MAG TPA: hypothetical protein VJH25_01690 [Candidatus Paceibacterota bacterium]
MLSPNQKQIILKYKTFYQNIKSIRCPYFKNEPVFFNRKGFNHLPRKAGELRSFESLVERLSLLPNCKFILTNSNQTNIEHRITIKGDSTAYFWTFQTIIDGAGIKLVVRQIDGRRKYFFSLFPLKH